MDSLAEVQMTYFKAGAQVPVGIDDDNHLAVIIMGDDIKPFPSSSGFNSVDICDLLEDYGKEQIIPHEYLSGQEGWDEKVYTFEYPTAFFSFQFFGQGYSREYAGGAEWDMREGEGIGGWFSEMADELVATGMKLLNEEKDPEETWDGSRFVRWVIGLYFSGSVDGWTGEYDCESGYIGRINLNQLKSCEDAD